MRHCRRRPWVTATALIVAATATYARTDIVNIDGAPIPEDLGLDKITAAITTGAAGSWLDTQGLGIRSC